MPGLLILSSARWLLFFITFSLLSRSALATVSADGTGQNGKETRLDRRAGPKSVDCGLWVPAWDLDPAKTTCKSFLAQYQLSVEALIALNAVFKIYPTGDIDICVGLFDDPWGKICVATADALEVSKDGKCGPNGNDAVCPGSTFGECCSVGGWCGSGYPYCGIGNCIAGNCVNGTGWSTDGRCGPDAMQPKCGGQYGKCCSKSGYCGNSTDHCSGDNCVAGSCTIPLAPPPVITWSFPANPPPTKTP